MDSLLESTVKCMQIQNSLYRLVLLKLSQHVNGAEGQTDAMSGNTSASDLAEARHTESTVPNRTYDAGALLCEVKEPLGALMRCADIQRGLFQKMITVNMMTTENGRITCQYKFLLRNSCCTVDWSASAFFFFFSPVKNQNNDSTKHLLVYFSPWISLHGFFFQPFLLCRNILGELPRPPNPPPPQKKKKKMPRPLLTLYFFVVLVYSCLLRITNSR